ncbi:MAG: ribosomal L7Ae/L30e/S12e/Gadd45 family protein [Clostridia bacterium]|nr:ribosomal L7Ae/L30e/S12e/Gadd45 family protein [Clostridia bacterium]
MQENNIVISESTEGKIKRFKFALSLARRAGKALPGTPLACEAIRKGEAVFVLISKTASENSKKRVVNCAAHYNTKLLYTELTPAELGAAIGKSPLACVGITDKNLAFNIERNLY